MSERASTKGGDDELASASIRPEPSSVDTLISELRSLAASLKRPGGKDSRITKACDRAAADLSSQSLSLSEARAILRDLVATLHVRGKMMTVCHDDLWGLERRARSALENGPAGLGGSSHG